MEGIPAIYKGRLVSKDNFRVYIYAPDGRKKLIESWGAFESHMQLGIWFASQEDARASVVEEEKPKAKQKQKSATEPKAIDAKERDDFLPKDS